MSAWELSTVHGGPLAARAWKPVQVEEGGVPFPAGIPSKPPSCSLPVLSPLPCPAGLLG